MTFNQLARSAVLTSCLLSSTPSQSGEILERISEDSEPQATLTPTEQEAGGHKVTYRTLCSEEGQTPTPCPDSSLLEDNVPDYKAPPPPITEAPAASQQDETPASRAAAPKAAGTHAERKSKADVHKNNSGKHAKSPKKPK